MVEAAGSARTMRALHVALGIAVCVLLPGLSWLDGTGRLSYPMFADLHYLHVRVVVVRAANGEVASVSPTLLGAKAGRTVGHFLSGTERPVLVPRAYEALAHLPDLAAFACRAEAAAKVTMDIETTELDGASARRTIVVDCRR